MIDCKVAKVSEAEGGYFLYNLVIQLVLRITTD